jgi:hypothetical protein
VIEWKTLQMYLMLFAVYICGCWFLKILDQMFALFGIMMIGGIFFYHEFFVERRFPVMVPLFIERKGRWSFRLDLASRRRDENGIEYYRLKNSKKNVKPPHFGNIIETSKGHVLPLFSPSEAEYRELNMDTTGKVSVMDEDMKQWYKYMVKKAYSDWAPEMSMWVRYMPVIFLAVLGGIVIVIMYILTGEMTMITSQFANAAAAVTNAVNGLGNVNLVVPPS